MNKFSYGSFFVIWGLVGILCFTLILLVVLKSGLMAKVRDENGELRKPMPLVGKLAKLMMVFSVVLYFWVVDYFGVVKPGFDPSFLHLFLLNLGLFLIILLYDTFVIDILIIVIWHPDFLPLTDAPGFTSIKYHLKTLLPGTLLGLFFSLLSSGVFAIFL